MEFNKQNILNKVKESQKTTVVMDEGLRAYMLKVYNYMATGVLLTGIIALLSFKMSVVTDSSGAISGFTSFGNALFFSGLKWIVMLAPLAIVFYMIARNLLKLSNERRKQVLGVSLKKKLITSFIVLSLMRFKIMTLKMSLKSRNNH